MSQYGPSSHSLTVRSSVPEPQASRPGNLGALIGRIEEAVDEETSAIRTDIHFDIKASNARKSRYLYELTRALKGAAAILISRPSIATASFACAKSSRSTKPQSARISTPSTKSRR